MCEMVKIYKTNMHYPLRINVKGTVYMMDAKNEKRRLAMITEHLN